MHFKQQRQTDCGIRTARKAPMTLYDPRILWESPKSGVSGNRYQERTGIHIKSLS